MNKQLFLKKQNRALTTDKFIAKSKAKYGDKYGYGKTIYVRKNIALIITCPTHGDIELTPDAHFWSRYGCSKCDFEIPRSIKKNKVLEKAISVHGGKYDYSRVNYVNMNDPVEIVCSKHGSFWQDLYSHTAKAVDCPNCAKESGKFSLDQFVAKARLTHGDAYDYSKVKYETNASKVIITCPKHGDFIQRAASHLAGCKCRKCFIEDQRKTTEDFVREAKLVHGDKFDYSQVDYHGNKQPVEIVCPVHGSFWLKPNSHTSLGTGCRFCQDSKGERAVELFLKKYGIMHIREYRLLPYRYRYDFYLPDHNVYIEFNGQQHYKPIEVFGGEEAFQKTKENDKIKRSLVKDLNGHLIVIPYTCLNEDAVERELIRSLKRIYRYWFVISGKIRVFRTALEVYRTFSLPPQTLVKDFSTVVEQSVLDARILF